MSLTEADELLAAELAFGLLDQGDAAAAAARADTDSAFAAVAERWREAAQELAGPPVPPPAGLWRRIETRLPANDSARWPTGWIAVLGLTGAVLSAIALLRPAPPPAAPSAPHPLVALLTAPDRQAALAVSIAADRHGLALDPIAPTPAGKAAELWIIPAGGAPRSLGVLPARPGWRAVPAPLAGTLKPGATLAISVEPAGGSRTGAPTGPVIASGTIFPT